jgi:hypothetical protein
MRALLISVALTIPFVSILAVTHVRADEKCYAGYRDITPTEREAMTTVLESALLALPPAPDGWVLVGDESLYVDPRVCQDNETEPWGYALSRSYQRTDDIDRRGQALDQAGGDFEAAMQAKQPRMDAIMARIQELSVQVVAAAEKNDMVKVDALNVELEQASAELEQVMAEGGTLDQADAAAEEASRDMDIRMEVAVNAGYEEVGYGSRKVTGAAGAERAYRWTTTRGSVTDETALILFGQWQEAGNGVGTVPRAGAAPTAAQALSVRVTADESRIESVLEGIDFEGLAALVVR